MTSGTDFADTSIVAALATQLHEEEPQHLRVELPLGQDPLQVFLPVGCRIIDRTVEFESLEARNTIVATAAYEQLGHSSEIDANTLFERAYALWRKEIGHSDKASGRLLALASEGIDILAVGAERIRAKSDVFDVLHLIEAALPYLSVIEVRSVISLMSAKYEPTKGDMAAGLINGALENWLGKHPEIARSLHARALEEFSEGTSSLLGNAIIALSKSDYPGAVKLAADDTKSEVLMRAQIGTWTLGRLLLDELAPQKEINAVVKLITDLIESEQISLRSEAIKSAVGAMHRDSAFDELLQQLARDGNQDVLCAAANALFYRREEIGARGLTTLWLQLLTALEPEFKGAIKNLDWAMSQLLPQPEFNDAVVSAFSQWVLNHGPKAAADSVVSELFDDTIRELLQLDSWPSVLTDWLLSENRAHLIVISEILSKCSSDLPKELRFDRVRLDELSPNDLLFLARRMLGYVFDRGQLTSLALSLLQSKNSAQRVYPLLHALLVDEIGYDYPGSTVETLCAAVDEMESVEDQVFLQRAVDSINRTLQAQMALPSLKEIQPSASLLRLFSRARAQQMADAAEEANKDSFWRQIATEIPIKAGMSTFSYRESSYGSSMKLSSISHSFELPRREVFDPIGNSIRLLGFRLAERGES